jgi:hypothetical protein
MASASAFAYAAFRSAAWISPRRVLFDGALNARGVGSDALHSAVASSQASGRPKWDRPIVPSCADSEGGRSAFRTDVDHHSEVMSIGVPN